MISIHPRGGRNKRLKMMARVDRSYKNDNNSLRQKA